MKARHSKNSLFLMEIIINLLLFALLMVAGLQLFIRSRTMTEQTDTLQRAVTSCCSAASVFESGDGTLEALLEHYHYSVNLNSRLIIYLDADFNECQRDDAQYYLMATPEEGTERLTRAQITCLTMQDEEIYALTACHYRQLQLDPLLLQRKGALR